MTQTEAESYRQRLLALINRLDLDRTDLKDETLHGTGGEASGSLSNVPLHLADLGSRHFEEEVNLTLLENQEQLMEEINAALVRIEQGTFGRCEKCRREITRERLQAVAYTRYCSDCSRRFAEQKP
jgi:RNA polymerase-binding transcription factor DksA